MKVKIGLAKFFTPQLHQAEKREVSGCVNKVSGNTSRVDEAACWNLKNPSAFCAVFWNSPLERSVYYISCFESVNDSDFILMFLCFCLVWADSKAFVLLLRGLASSSMGAKWVSQLQCWRWKVLVTHMKFFQDDRVEVSNHSKWNWKRPLFFGGLYIDIMSLIQKKVTGWWHDFFLCGNGMSVKDPKQWNSRSVGVLQFWRPWRGIIFGCSNWGEIFRLWWKMGRWIKRLTEHLL